MGVFFLPCLDTAKCLIYYNYCFFIKFMNISINAPGNNELRSADDLLPRFLPANNYGELPSSACYTIWVSLYLPIKGPAMEVKLSKQQKVTVKHLVKHIFLS